MLIGAPHRYSVIGVKGFAIVFQLFEVWRTRIVPCNVSRMASRARRRENRGRRQAQEGSKMAYEHERRDVYTKEFSLSFLHALD
jgi:hypothetical protein